ncbi:MAG: DUF2683 family protein, partial [Candidatus Diapherotrites archaeon]|nr:DUF2683 family protein [Candidatus Diapherotrites archaeon]
MAKSVTMNLKVKDYTSRVLGIVKEKYGLRDKAEALDKFTEIHGDGYMENEAREEYVKKILRITEEHYRKHPNRRMTDKEL